MPDRPRGVIELARDWVRERREGWCGSCLVRDEERSPVAAGTGAAGSWASGVGPTCEAIGVETQCLPATLPSLAQDCGIPAGMTGIGVRAVGWGEERTPTCPNAALRGILAGMGLVLALQHSYGREMKWEGRVCEA